MFVQSSRYPRGYVLLFPRSDAKGDVGYSEMGIVRERHLDWLSCRDSFRNTEYVGCTEYQKLFAAVPAPRGGKTPHAKLPKPIEGSRLHTRLDLHVAGSYLCPDGATSLVVRSHYKRDFGCGSTHSENAQGAES
jgi:hypothetical protein